MPVCLRFMGSNDTIGILADRVDEINCRKCGAVIDVSRAPSFSSVTCPSCQAVQPVPAVLGPFLLLERMGAGGMGEVYRAVDRSLNRYVAIKVMQASMGEDPQFVENFLREARAAAAINHRNVVQIYSCGQEKGQPYIVMELVSGGRLDDMMADGKRIEPERALEIGLDVARGLNAAFEIGMMHGDIKPANILFDKGNTAKVVDFGLARFIRGAETGEIWGTPYYIAPEKARHQHADQRSDIYSLGATLYHAIAGQPPFDGETASDVVLERLKHPAPNLRETVADLHPRIADLVARMLEADPFMRYPTYPSLIADIEDTLRVVHPLSGHAPPPPKRSRKPLWIGLAAALLVALGMVFALTGREKPEPAPVPPPAVEPSPAVEPAPAETAAVVEIVFTPFDDREGEQAVEAFKQLEEGRAAGMVEKLQRMYDRANQEALDRAWIRVFQGVPWLVEGRARDALTYWDEVARQPFPEVPEGKADPRFMPIGVAAFLMGRTNDAALAGPADSRPDWFEHMTPLWRGLRALDGSDLETTLEHLRAYVDQPVGKPAWPYALQGAARQWVKAFEAWQAEERAERERMEAGELQEAKEALKAFRASHPAFLHAWEDRLLKAIEQTEEKAREQERRAEEARRQEERARDLERLAAIRAAQRPLVARMDYAQAGLQAAKAGVEMRTAEGRRGAQDLREVYRRLGDWKDFLSDQINRSAFPRAASGGELPGDAVGANSRVLTIRLGAHGETEKAWSDLSIRLVLAMGNYYLSRAELSPDERAGILFDLALYCYENGGAKAAQQYADQAVALDAALRPLAARYMPEQPEP